jgi:hypothetical protein
MVQIRNGYGFNGTNSNTKAIDEASRFLSKCHEIMGFLPAKKLKENKLIM